MIDNQPDQSDVETLIENAESENWDVTDWNLQTGAYEQPEVTLTVEYDGTSTEESAAHPTPKATIKNIIAEIEGSYEEGAPIDEVKTAIYEQDIDVDPSEKIETLRRKGEVYEPKEGHLRTT